MTPDAKMKKTGVFKDRRKRTNLTKIKGLKSWAKTIRQKTKEDLT